MGNLAEATLDISREIVPLASIAFALIVTVVGLICAACYGIARTAAREKSRRELAAYVAEGSMTPEDAERLLTARVRREQCMNRSIMP